jgi:translation initiation factor 1 (eIF-1/SUI1)
MGNLPVYSDVRKFGQRKVTILRKFAGDERALAAELERVCNAPVTPYHGRLEVKGNHVATLKEWLTGLGF